MSTGLSLGINNTSQHQSIIPAALTSPKCPDAGTLALNVIRVTCDADGDGDGNVKWSQSRR